MPKILEDISRTFNEFLLLPGLTTAKHQSHEVNLSVPLAKYARRKTPRKILNIPLTASAMQSVSGPELAISLARKGGAAFIFSSQPVEEQAQMVRQVKEHKAGFVTSDSNLSPNSTLQDAIDIRMKTGHSTIAITEDGTLNSKFLGLLTQYDFWEYKDNLSAKVKDFYTPLKDLGAVREGASLEEANIALWKTKRNCVPAVDKKGKLAGLVFRKDYYDSKRFPEELIDSQKRLVVGAALNTHDFRERAPALVDAGVDCLVVDSSDGYTEWQKEAVQWVRKKYGSEVVIGGGNVVSADGFRYLVEEADVDFVKIGIGGGSICITREQKGIGRGQASAVLEIAEERNRYFQETGIYVPICSDGAVTTDTNVIIALALGADFVMMGRYFAGFEESPTERISYSGKIYKPYWGEGSQRARNWQRYKQSSRSELIFEEGVDAYVPYAGHLSDRVDITTAKLRSTMCNCGVLGIGEFHEKAVLTRVSELTIVESGTSSVEQFNNVRVNPAR